MRRLTLRALAVRADASCSLPSSSHAASHSRFVQSMAISLFMYSPDSIQAICTRTGLWQVGQAIFTNAAGWMPPP